MQPARVFRSWSSALVLSGLVVFSARVHADFVYARLVPGTGMQPNGASTDVAVSSSGRTVVFSTSANNWVDGDTYNGDRVVAVDLDTGTVEVVSATAQGVIMRGEAPAVSADGRYVAFLTYGSPLGPNWQVARKDRRTGELVLASANAAGQAAVSGTGDDTVSISADGRYVAFDTAATNFGLPSGSSNEIFVKDMVTGQVKMASVKSDGGAGGQCTLAPHALSDDGRYLAFVCGSAVLPGAGSGQVYVRDLFQNGTELVSRAGSSGAPATSFSYRPAISPDGRYVTFQSRCYGGLGYAGADCTSNSGLYLRDRLAQATLAIPRPAAIAANGYDSCTTSAVSSLATVLLACPLAAGAVSYSQVFLHVPGAGAPSLLSTNAGSQPGNEASGASLAVNGSGLSMVFESRASDIDPDDTNDASDVFILVDETMLSEAIFANGFER
jgi:hypothetical protein